MIEKKKDTLQNKKGEIYYRLESSSSGSIKVPLQFSHQTRISRCEYHGIQLEKP